MPALNGLGQLSLPRRLTVSLVFCCVLFTVPWSAWADDVNRISILEENDSIYFNSDQHYTQGLRISDLVPDISPDSVWNGPFSVADTLASIFAQDGSATDHTRRYALLLGQSIFTPTYKSLSPPDPHDRPYGGWLYAGASLLQDSNHRMLENLEIDLGIVGPGALGRVAQNDFHQFIGVAQAKGWAHEIQTEPGLLLSYERLWRVPLVGDSSFGIDVVPQIGATVGNVFTYGEIGTLLRIGRNLQADYGQARIRPALSGTDYFDGAHLDGNFGYYLFGGVQGRVVGLNVFLDGNSFRSSPNVDKKPLVADAQAGFSLFWSNNWRVEFSAVRRTREFEGQTSPDWVGTAMLAFTL